MDEVRAELKVRRRLESIFNKQAEEFNSKKEYDDYLETREEYIFNLALSMDVMATEGKIAEYQRMNHENIIMNRSRQIEASRQAQAAANGGVDIVSAPTEPAAAAAPEAAPQTAADNLAYIPNASMAGASASAALPVPMHLEWSEDQYGCLVLAPARRKRKHWHSVAAASGWDPKLGLKKLFAETLQSLL